MDGIHCVSVSFAVCAIDNGNCAHLLAKQTDATGDNLSGACVLRTSISTHIIPRYNEWKCNFYYTIYSADYVLYSTVQKRYRIHEQVAHVQ